MKYKKGTFVVVPNKNYLRGLPSEVQSVYFWICEHSNDEGECFPSRKKLAQESGTGLRRLDKYIKQLEEIGLIIKTFRPRVGTKSKLSNLYQVQLLDDIVAEIPNSSSQMDNLGSSQMDAVTISNTNEPHLTNLATGNISPEKEVNPPFSFIVELNKLGDSKWKPDLIIHNYWKYKHFVFDNEKQFKSERSRNKIPALKLEGYTSKQINDTMDYCEKNYAEIGWTLETVAKTISRVVNVKK